MSMTVVVTRNVSMRVRGFLASAMLELASGTYSAPRISPAVRERIWTVLEDWIANEADASVIMLWQERGMPGGQAVRMLGSPPIDLVDLNGIVLAKRRIAPSGANQ